MVDAAGRFAGQAALRGNALQHLVDLPGTERCDDCIGACCAAQILLETPSMSSGSSACAWLHLRLRTLGRPMQGGQAPTDAPGTADPRTAHAPAAALT